MGEESGQPCQQGHGMREATARHAHAHAVVAHVLLPMSMMTMLGLEWERASSSHVVRWLNVSRLRDG